MSYKRIYTSYDKGHRHHVDLPLDGLGGPLHVPYFCDALEAQFLADFGPVYTPWQQAQMSLQGPVCGAGRVMWWLGGYGFCKPPGTIAALQLIEVLDQSLSKATLPIAWMGKAIKFRNALVDAGRGAGTAYVWELAACLGNRIIAHDTLILLGNVPVPAALKHLEHNQKYPLRLLVTHLLAAWLQQGANQQPAGGTFKVPRSPTKPLVPPVPVHPFPHPALKHGDFKVRPRPSMSRAMSGYEGCSPCAPCTPCGFGEEGDRRYVEKTVDGVTFKLLTSLPTADWYVSPTSGNEATWAGVSMKGSEVSWLAAQGAVPWRAWVEAEKARGQAVMGTSGDSMPSGTPKPTVDGVPIADNVEGMLVSTRDLGLVKRLTAADPGAVVLFEPAGGWDKPQRAQLIGGLAIAALAVGGIYFYYAEAGRR